MNEQEEQPHAVNFKYSKSYIVFSGFCSLFFYSIGGEDGTSIREQIA